MFMTQSAMAWSSRSAFRAFLQFAKNEDFDKYPRQREADRAMLRAAGCHATFEPESLYVSREVLLTI